MQKLLERSRSDPYHLFENEAHLPVVMAIQDAVIFGAYATNSIVSPVTVSLWLGPYLPSLARNNVTFETAIVSQVVSRKLQGWNILGVRFYDFLLVQASSANNNVKNIDFSFWDIQTWIVCVRAIIKSFLFVFGKVAIGCRLDNTRKTCLFKVCSSSTPSTQIVLLCLSFGLSVISFSPGS
jgi:hypothetical protein